MLLQSVNLLNNMSLLVFLLQIKEHELRLNWCSKHTLSLKAKYRNLLESEPITKILVTPPNIPKNINLSKRNSTKNTVTINLLQRNNQFHRFVKQVAYILVSDNFSSDIIETFEQSLLRGNHVGRYGSTIKKQQV